MQEEPVSVECELVCMNCNAITPVLVLEEQVAGVRGTIANNNRYYRCVKCEGKTFMFLTPTPANSLLDTVLI
jgi:DNA-directed RNA polymerase subunit RPC12/RpoP